MRQSYEKFRNEVKEIEELFKKKMMTDMDVSDIADRDPDLIILLLKMSKLLNTSDEFTMACIEAMETQNEKLDKILNKLN